MTACVLLPTLLAAPPAAAQRGADAAGAPVLTIDIGRAIVPLEGPWRFHTGDDPRWANPDFDDSAWETADLTPPAGAHDPDVGLKGYVRGWGARGHRGYAGYAWYRMRVSVNAPDGATVALAGPLEVDEAYQVFVNGRRLGGSGRFAGATPVVYNTRPEMFALASAPPPPHGLPNEQFLIAFRVWVGPELMREVPDGGGIRIAPAIGELGAISAHHQLDWLAKVLGYVVEVVEAVAFVLLAVMAASVAMFEPSKRAYRWLAAALVLIAIARANQAVFYWTTWESARTAILLRFVFVDPLALGAWAMAWRTWFGVERPSWLPRTIGVLTALYVLTDLVAASSFGWASHAALAFVTPLRLLFVLTMAIIIYGSAARPGAKNWLAVAAMLLVSIGLYAQEVSALGVPGIWFPFGVGVSRTQYAYAAFVIVAFVVLLRRLAAFARAGLAAGISIQRHEAFD